LFGVTDVNEPGTDSDFLNSELQPVHLNDVRRGERQWISESRFLSRIPIRPAFKRSCGAPRSARSPRRGRSSKSSEPCPCSNPYPPWRTRPRLQNDYGWELQ